MAHKSFTLAIRILHELTLFSSPHPLRELARTLHVSASYLEQTIRPLRRAGIVLGTKGPRGGYVLSRNLATVTVEDILTLHIMLVFLRLSIHAGYSKIESVCY